MTLGGNQSFIWWDLTFQPAFSTGYLWAENGPGGQTIIKGNVDFDATAEFQVAVADGGLNAAYWEAFDVFL